VLLSDALGLGRRRKGKLKQLRIRKITAALALAVLAVMLYTSRGVAARQKASRDVNMEHYRWAYGEVLGKQPVMPVYCTGWQWFNKLSYYYMPDIRFATMKGQLSSVLRNIENESDPGRLSGCHVILDRNTELGRQLSYDDLPGYVLLPPEEWKLIAARGGIEIYRVPKDWEYGEPDGGALVRGALGHAAVMRDPTRFLYCLHPDFVRERFFDRGQFDRNGFFRQFNEIGAMTPSERERFFDEKLRYSEDKGKMKIHIGADQKGPL